MSWQESIVFSQCEYEPDHLANTPSRMKPGLTNTYDRDLREKASIRGNPTPPDCMGLEGEYDPFGLAKRVAQALDGQSQLAHIKTLNLVQKGNKIVYHGHVPNRQILDAIVEITAGVDGTHAVDTRGVTLPSRSTVG